jgi:arginyl-tRNA synthetase
MRKKIKEITILALKGLTEKKYFPDEELGKELKIEIPRQDCQGDYASNLPLLLAKKNSKQPLEIGEIIKKEIEKADKDNLLEKIEIAPPGFINFFLSKDIVQKQVEEILAQGKSFGAVDLGKKKKGL